jgi:tetratricopeptide (TPR) repeat protein
VFERHGDDRGLSLLHNTRAQVSWFRGRCEEARIAWDAAADHARRCGEAWLVPEILVWTASALQLGPEPVGPAIARCAALVEETREHLMSQAFIRRPLALLHALDGDFPAARAELVASSDLYVELGDTIHSAARSHEAEVAFLEGDLEGSERVLRDSIERLAAMGDRSFHAVVTLQLARTVEAQGRHDEALALADEGSRLAAGEDAVAQVLWRTVRARILTVRGEAQAAVGLAVEACAIAAPTDWLTGRGEAAFARGVAHRAAGAADEAEQAFAEALAAYDRKGARTMAGSAIAWLAQHDHPAPRRPAADATERTETCSGLPSMPT